MTRERGLETDYRGRSPPRVRNFDHLRRREYSPPISREIGSNLGEFERSRRVEKRDDFDRGTDSGAKRFTDYRERDGDRYMVGARRSNSPRRFDKRDNIEIGAQRLSDYRDKDGDGYKAVARRLDSPVRVDKRDHFDRDINLRAQRLSDYRDRDGDGYRAGARLEKREHFDRDLDLRFQRLSNYSRRSKSPGKFEKRDHSVRFSEYGDGGKDRDSNRVDAGRLMRISDYSGRSKSPVKMDHSVRFSGYDDGRKDRDSIRVDAGRLMRLSDDDSYRWDLNSKKFQRDNSKKSDGVDLKDYSYTRDYSGIGDANIITRGGGGERDKHTHGQYLETGRPELLSGSPYLARTEPVSLKYERGERMPSDLYPLARGGEGSSHVASRYLNTDTTNKQGYFHTNLEKRDVDFRVLEERNSEIEDGELHFLDKMEPGGREVFKYKKEESPLPSSLDYMKGDSDYLVSLRKEYDEDFHGYSTTRGFHMPSDSNSKPIGVDRYGEKLENVSPRESGGRLEDIRSHSRSYVQFGGNKIDSSSTRRRDFEESSRDHEISRIGILDPIVDESPRRKIVVYDDGIWDPYPSSHGQSSKFDGSSYLNYGSETYRGYRSITPQEDSTAELGPYSRDERSDVLQNRDYETSYDNRLYDSTPRKALTDVDLIQPSSGRLGYKHHRDEELFDHGAGIRISSDGNGARKIYRQVDEMDRKFFSKKQKISISNYEKSDSRDIKKRLGPVVPQRLHVSQRLVKNYKPSIKKRLAPAQPPPKKSTATLPWLQNQKSNKKSNHVKDGSDANPQDQGDAAHLADNVHSSNLEPPEKSEEFKQMVQSAFFKYLKQINDTPVKRNSYMEQEKAGSLKCIVCGSHSEEFLDTKSLASHAFTCKTVGLKSQHLGLHKALCVLMGWKITQEGTISEWHCELMSNTESSALKEDFIIWPPLVIVHNSTIENKNPDERVVVSTEKLGRKLKGTGFRSIVKVCNGKPANQSVILVKFKGILSGLQEAERLHNSYGETNHGRAELERLEPSEDGEKQQLASAKDEDNILYGYLGLAEDLDKLDSDSKKRCVLRSKKEISSIVDTPLDTVGGKSS